MAVRSAIRRGYGGASACAALIGFLASCGSDEATGTMGTGGTGGTVSTPPIGVPTAGAMALPGTPGGQGTPSALEGPLAWPSFGGDLFHTRTSSAEQRISRQTIASLRSAWNAPAPGVTGTPAIVDGVVYFADWQGGVHALRVADGSAVWRQQLPMGVTSSPFVTDSTVYLGDRLSSVHALDRSTGALLWSRSIDPSDRAHLYSSPIVIDGTLIIGVSSDGTQRDRNPIPVEEVRRFRGSVVGLRASDGVEIWRFQTTDWNLHGTGVPVWSTASVDPVRKLAFIGTGNGYEFPVSQYSDALLALNYLTGQLVWHRQFTANDAFTTATSMDGPDSDVGAAPNLFAIQQGGQTREVVGVGEKAGAYHVLARDTGELIWETLLAPVAFDTKVGGIIAPAAYDGRRIYVASNTGYASHQVWALDATTGAIAWKSEDFYGTNFGAPAVAGGVLFFGSAGIDIVQTVFQPTGVGLPGELVAFDTDTGTILHRTTLPAGRGGGFAVLDGRVYVGTGFSFFAYAIDEPLQGGLSVFTVP